MNIDSHLCLFAIIRRNECINTDKVRIHVKVDYTYSGSKKYLHAA